MLKYKKDKLIPKQAIFCLLCTKKLTISILLKKQSLHWVLKINHLKLNFVVYKKSFNMCTKCIKKCTNMY